ncbi:unnamed protein product, partial [Iphiclides podalirius]
MQVHLASLDRPSLQRRPNLKIIALSSVIGPAQTRGGTRAAGPALSHSTLTPQSLIRNDASSGGLLTARAHICAETPIARPRDTR